MQTTVLLRSTTILRRVQQLFLAWKTLRNENSKYLEMLKNRDKRKSKKSVPQKNKNISRNQTRQPKFYQRNKHFFPGTILWTILIIGKGKNSDKWTKIDAYNFRGFWNTNGSSNSGQTTRPCVNHQEKNRTFDLLDFAVTADQRKKMKERQKMDKYLKFASELKSCETWGWQWWQL